jgi:hypothetical protein
MVMVFVADLDWSRGKILRYVEVMLWTPCSKLIFGNALLNLTFPNLWFLINPFPSTSATFSLNLSKAFLQMNFLPRGLEIQKWTSTQVVLTGVAAGIITGIAFCFFTAYFLPSNVEDLDD